jgi:hypothetical protein
MPAGFTLGNALLVTVGRLRNGIAQALAPRYITYSVMLPVALLFLGTLILRHWRARHPTAESAASASAVAACVVTALALLLVLGSVDSLSDWSKEKRCRLIDKALVLSINVVDEPHELDKWVYPFLTPLQLKERMNALNRLGYFRPPLLRSRNIREIAKADTPGSTAYGEIEQGVKNQEGFALVGSVFLPESQRAADAVLLTCDDPQGNPVIFALAVPPRRAGPNSSTASSGRPAGDS